MEKKTIGKFISVLRRANGMTQKQLGEKLYVSDKTVSRWEREECTPELSLIPVIAEIFGISTDELLRGERNSGDGCASKNQKIRSDMQFRLMLHNRSVKFRNLSMITVGISLSGLILAAAINASFSRGILAFAIGTIILLAAAICQLCFASTAVLGVEEEDEPQISQLREFNSQITIKTTIVLSLILILFAALLPLGIFPGNGYYGLRTGVWAVCGVIFAGIMLILLRVLYVFWIEGILTEKGLLCRTWEEPLKKAVLRRMLAIAGLIFLVLLILVGGVQMFGPDLFARNEIFYQCEDFQAYMKQLCLETLHEEYGDGKEILLISGARYVVIDGINLEYGNMESRTLQDENGDVLCEFLELPHMLEQLRYSVKEDGTLDYVSVVSNSEMSRAHRIVNTLKTALVWLMMLDFLICGIVYAVKLKQK